LTLLLALSTLTSWQTAAAPSALFVDCEGHYLRASTRDGKVESHGMVQRLAGAQMLEFARDGCAVDQVRAGNSASLVELTVQNFMWESKKVDPAYARLTLHLPEFKVQKRETSVTRTEEPRPRGALTENQRYVIYGFGSMRPSRVRMK
jgi:hypothetical protein